MAANDKQVGGDHYRRDFQHWDLMIQVGASYMVGQVTRYTERHAKKNGREDLEKALHYAQKMQETARPLPVLAMAELEKLHGEAIREYAIRANLSAVQLRIFEMAILRPDLPDALAALCELHLKMCYPTPSPVRSQATPEDGAQHAVQPPEMNF